MELLSTSLPSPSVVALTGPPVYLDLFFCPPSSGRHLHSRGLATTEHRIPGNKLQNVPSLNMTLDEQDSTKIMHVPNCAWTGTIETRSMYHNGRTAIYIHHHPSLAYSLILLNTLYRSSSRSTPLTDSSYDLSESFFPALWRSSSY